MADSQEYEGAVVDPLTDRELDVVRLMRRGLTNREIADELVIAPGTVKWYTKQIYGKLGVSNRTEASLRATELGLFERSAAETLEEGEAESPRHNLSAPITSFVGRRQEVAEVTTLLQSSRLVTLLGPGGTGKTRLALKVSRGLIDNFEDGVYFVDLAPLSDPGLVEPTIAATMGLSVGTRRSVRDTLHAYLHERSLLLLLDNFEHLVQVAPLVGDLLAAAPNVKILVTSREVLHLYGENTYQVPPLRLPPAEASGKPAELREYESVQLFADRASSVRPDFALNDENAPLIAQICVRLDGLPLAIELAAARMRLFTLETLAEELSHRLNVLRRGPRDAPSRQQTLRATIDWSYQLLDRDEQALFTRLSIFRGGCSIEALEVVCDPDLQRDVVEVVESLLDKSLLHPGENAAGEPRFLMLETVREYSREKLEESGKRNELRRRHAAYFLSLAQRARPHLRGGRRQLKWLHRLEPDHDNLRSALSWALGGADVELGLRLAVALIWFWYRRGHYYEWEQWFRQAVAKIEQAPLPVRADLRLMQGALAYALQDTEFDIAPLREAEDIYRRLGDKEGTAYALMFQGIHAVGRSQAFEDALSSAEAALSLMREVGDEVGITQALNVIGEVTRDAGEYERAREAYEEALGIATETGDRLREHFMYLNLGFMAQREGRCAEAANLITKSLSIARDTAVKSMYPTAVAALAGPLASLGHLRQAARLLGASAALKEATGMILQPADQVEIDRYEEAVRNQLDEAAFEAAWQEGHTLSWDEAVALAMSSGSQAQP